MAPESVTIRPSLMPWLPTLILLLGLWLIWAGIANWLLVNPRSDTISGLTYRFIQIYSRLVHRLRVINPHNIPRERYCGPLIVVCNHTAGIDPMLIQAACPFYVRWMMAEDMKWGGLADVWSYFNIIFVDRTKPDTRALREAVRALKASEIIGVSASATTSIIASEFGVMVEPMMTSTLCSAISLRVFFTAVVVSEASSRMM